VAAGAKTSRKGIATTHCNGAERACACLKKARPAQSRGARERALDLDEHSLQKIFVVFLSRANAFISAA